MHRLIFFSREGAESLEYRTVKQEADAFFLEKKSKFIGSCRPVSTEAEALAFVERVRGTYPDASHTVYAYVLREGGVQRFSDDGEPQGTAGIPVLETLKKAGLTDIVVTATRYFGGILLGGGGLIRAYSHTASIAVAAAQKIVMRECLCLSLRCDYAMYGRVGAVVPECGGTVDGTEFLEQVEICFHLEAALLPALLKRLADATNGACVPTEREKRYFAFPLGEAG